MLLASVMLVAMNLASCKMSNKPAAETSRIGEIPEAALYTVRGSVVVSSIAEKDLYAIPADGAAMFGPESYHLHDYGFFFNNFKQNVADRVKAFMEKK